MRCAGFLALVMAGLTLTARAQTPAADPAATPAASAAATPAASAETAPASPAATAGAAPAATPARIGPPAAADGPGARGAAPDPDRMRQKLDWLVGTWDVSMKLVMGSKEPPVEAQGTQSFAKVLNGHFIGVDTQAQSPRGTIQARGLLTYDRPHRVYRFWHFNDLGEFTELEGNWESDHKLVLSALSRDSGSDIAARQRVTIQKLSETEFRYVLETDRGSGFKQDVEMTARKKGA